MSEEIAAERQQYLRAANIASDISYVNLLKTSVGINKRPAREISRFIPRHGIPYYTCESPSPLKNFVKPDKNNRTFYS